MVSLTLSVPESLRQRMKAHSEIKWSEVVRSIISQQLEELEEADRIASRSKLTENDVIELSDMVEKSALKKWKELKNEAGG